MQNYKIKVNNEAESREAQELFKQLGFKWAGDHPKNNDWYSHLYAENSTCCYLSPYVWGGLVDRFKELTLPQLRDMVVLHRNDVNDATHKHIGGAIAYKTVDEIAYLWTRMGWEYKGVAQDLVPLHKEDEQGLISGADALRALADGKEIEFDTGVGTWHLVHNGLTLHCFDSYKFRLKPRTITLNVEIPAPFEPKHGDEIWFLNPDYGCGYADGDYDPAESVIQFGAWRTEEEIKQVVAALRGALKNG